MKKRDDLLAYYDFQRDANDPRDENGFELLRNRAKTGPRFDGRLMGTLRMGMAAGRFPGKQALRFDTLGDGVRVDIPVECRQMTLAAWVRIESSAKWKGVLLMSDGWNEPGKTCWLLRDGGVGFGYFNGRGSQAIDSPPVVRADFADRWRMLAVVADQDARKATFFADGESLGQSNLPIATSSPLFALRAAMIGTWNHLGVHPADDRTLQGYMDELMIFNAALSPEEIRRLYDTGLGIRD